MKKILLVDDMEITNFITESFIRNINPAHNVYNFTDPVKAFGEVTTIDPDVILLDLNMPELDGWGFLDRMQESQMAYNVYILSSSTSELDKKRSSTYGNVVGFLVKPLEEDVLSNILETNAR
ncbi:response regulator [Pontibacter sp. JH31]|uniref:Response regulator n=1 Tax=Pontibacter aquaedesilientis TaxID=2766980 RepID=A0ABR7XHI2_9BACT|nr:response regulator [Pontibacter aquaedesilientis]MBD1397093.1 response regulator [Pontibacter aquaedesilientis]